MKPGDQVIVDAWAHPAAAHRCFFPKDYRTKATLDSEEIVEAFGTLCYRVTTDTGHKILAPVSCVSS